jgi:hypothetical protein
MAFLAELLGIPEKERAKTLLGLGLIAFLREEYEDYKYKRKKNREEEF